MKLLTLLFSIVAHAATPGAVPSVTVSAPGANTGQVSIPPSDLAGTALTSHKIFSLHASSSGTTSGFWYVLYRDGIAYATGATTRAYCFDITAMSGSGGSPFQLVSSQAAIANNNSTALTAPAYQGGASGTYTSITNVTANVVGVIPGVYVFGNGANVTYAGTQFGGGVSQAFMVHMDCFEQ
jgi:hypothetical protein